MGIHRDPWDLGIRIFFEASPAQLLQPPDTATHERTMEQSLGHWDSPALPSLIGRDTCGCWAAVLQGLSFPAVLGICF